MMSDYRNLATELVAALKKQGADACDVYVVTSSGFSTNVRLGKIEKLQQSISKGLGLRVLKNNAQALTFTTDFTDKSVKELVAETLSIVKVSNADEYNGLPPKELLGVYPGKLELFDPAIGRLSPEKKIELVMEAEDAGMRYDKRITNTSGSSWSDGVSSVTLANSDGFAGRYESTFAVLQTSLLAEENDVKQTDGWFTFSRFLNKLEAPKLVGQEAGRRVIRKLGGKKVKSQKVPVVVDPMVSRGLVSQIFGAASGRGIFRKSSFLVDRLGEQIASPLITIVDDGVMHDGPASRPFDGEGVRSSQVTVLEKGVLKNYVCDSYSARRLKLQPTGNAGRNYQSVPFISSSNLHMKAGTSKPADIIKSVKNGLYLISVFGQGFNGVTGDLSQGAAGIWIENGELTYPVQEITLAGNLLTMVKNVTMVGDDLSFRFGGTAAPTLLISEATIGGE